MRQKSHNIACNACVAANQTRPDDLMIGCITPPELELSDGPHTF